MQFMRLAMICLIVTPFAAPLEGVAHSRWCGPVLRTGTTQIAIEGTLIQRVIWGPPNFGERPKTDRRYPIWILRLNYPVPVWIYVQSEPNKFSRTKAWLSEVQLIPNTSQIAILHEHLGRALTAIGMLGTADTPAEATPVVMTTSHLGAPPSLVPSCNGGLAKLPTNL